ncbi:MAG: glycosyltransferase family 4 protein [Elusimicrobiaceae bacterium]|nr:glycosyltransferase family 4 protein [Elusimicrobiaceae bacterium]
MNALEKLGNQLLAFNAVTKGAVVNSKYVSIMDEKVIHKECFSKYDRFLYPLKQYKFERAVIDETDIHSFDLIHSHTLFNGGWAAYRIYKKYKIPYVVTVRNTDLNDYLKLPFFRYIAKVIINNASGILFLSTSYRDAFFKKIYGKKLPQKLLQKTTVIPNGLENFWHQNRGNPKTVIHRPLKFLCVGKIDTNKNILCVLLAMEKLKLQGIDSSLTVIGQIVDKNVYAILKENKNVTLVNYLSKEELVKYYRENDIFIMPSIFESFGRVYAEAMSQGLPVIYTQGQGFDGLFPEGCVGYHVPAREPQKIALVTKQILDNYSDISSKCVEKSTIFNWNDIAKKLQDFYQNVTLKTGEKK